MRLPHPRLANASHPLTQGEVAGSLHLNLRRGKTGRDCVLDLVPTAGIELAFGRYAPKRLEA